MEDVTVRSCWPWWSLGTDFLRGILSPDQLSSTSVTTSVTFYSLVSSSLIYIAPTTQRTPHPTQCRSFRRRRTCLCSLLHKEHRHVAYWIPRESISPNSTWLVTSRHDTTRHVRRVDPMHFGCVELVEQHGSTHSTRRARFARHAQHVERDWLDTFGTTSATGATRNLVCCVICIKLWYVSYSLIYWSIHLFNLFYLTEQIGFVYARA